MRVEKLIELCTKHGFKSINKETIREVSIIISLGQSICSEGYRIQNTEYEIQNTKYKIQIFPSFSWRIHATEFHGMTLSVTPFL